MSGVGAFRRKLTKLRKNPKRFLTDSGNPALRALGVAMSAPWAGTTLRKARSKINVKEARELIEASGLFNAPYYLEQNPDIQKRDLDPLTHYLKHGMHEERAPNAMFDPTYYARQAGISARDHPLIHYIREGEAKGLRPHKRFDPVAYKACNPDLARTTYGPLEHYLKIGQYEARSTMQPLASALGAWNSDLDLRDLPITILIPVYNNRDYVRRCIDSVLAHTRLPNAELLLIDDASPDPVTRALLVQYARLPNVTALRNEVNLGFTRTVNRGIDYARGRDVVLLNSDTVVSPRWLEALALVAYGSRKIATATALSDNAGAFSTPAVNANDTSTFISVAGAARLSQRAASYEAHIVPTGNGFCMYMRRDAIEATGLMDEVHFPRGYGEENEWCMRAGERGWRHAIALRSYVHHVNAVSFGAEAKQKLRSGAGKVLEQLHPDYSFQVRRAFRSGTPFTMQRYALAESLAKVKRSSTPPRPRLLFVISTTTGGTPHSNEDLMRGVSHLYEPLLLICDTRELRLLDWSETAPRELARYDLIEPISIIPHRSAEYDAIVGEWMSRFGIELLHIRHIAWHSLGLVETAQRLRIPVVFSFHDFYTMCPSVNLTNGKDAWSEDGVSSPHVHAPLWTQRDRKAVEAVQSMDPHVFLARWKRQMNAMLARCDAFVTTSHSVKDILSKNLPVLRKRAQDFYIIPHGRDFPQLLAPGRPPRRNEPLRVLLPGNINEPKGLDTVLELLRLNEDQVIELHAIGGGGAGLAASRRVKNHGRYARGDFNKLVSKIAPHVGFIPTICPETFCHALTECWAAGLPVVGSNLGAVGERIRESGAGWAVDPRNAQEILALFRRIRDGEEDWSERVQALTRWRQTTAEWNVAAMTDKYLDVYRSVTRRQRTFLSGKRALIGLRTRIAVVGRGHFPSCRPTSHVRVATPLSCASGEHDYDWIDAAELICADVRDYDGVVVCRNAGEPRVLSELARQCREHKVPLVLDLDDDLLHIPMEMDPSGTYRAAAPAMWELLSIAALTTVSTPRLLSIYGPLTREVRVVPNRLNKQLWCRDLSGEVPALPELDREAPIRVLYMGSRTHHEDLELILPALERLRAECGVVLHIVGVTNQAPPGVVIIAPPEERYDLFVQWFRSIAPYFDFAVAPLMDSKFNRAKSALKFMEYAMSGLPVVASRVEPYVDVVRHGIDGLLADADTESWYEQLLLLITDHELRKRLAENARIRAEEEFVCRSCVFDELPWHVWNAEAAERSAESTLQSDFSKAADANGAATVDAIGPAAEGC
jgi:GT2 family glycosyltransferase/glycosyltransferase involved in cell wall biosynthesis